MKKSLDINSELISKIHRRPSTMQESMPKVGISNSLNKPAKFMKNYLHRRRLLTVPEDVLRSHPDKHFAFINLNSYEKNGRWNNDGYKLFKTNVDSEHQHSEKFNDSPDGLVHRNEMVLAWIPKEEYLERQEEEAFIRQARRRTDVFLKNPSLSGFRPTATETVEQVSA